MAELSRHRPLVERKTSSGLRSRLGTRIPAGLAELAPRVHNDAPHLGDAFARIAQDEDRHARLFGVFADALTDDDHLRPGVTTAHIAAQVAAISEYFLPIELRPTATQAHTLGSHLGDGAPVHITQGAPGDDATPALRDLLTGFRVARTYN